MPRALHGTAQTDDLASFATIGAALGVSTQRAQQLVGEALRHARAVCEQRGIDPRAFFDALSRDSHACRVEPDVRIVDGRNRGPREHRP
jgi:hypothetical protein